MRKLFDLVQGIIVLVVLVAIPLGLIAAYPVAYRLSADELVIKVDKTEAVNTAKTRTYMAFTEDGSVFQIADSWSFWHFAASDVYGQMKPGQTYRVKIAGWRVPFLSWYRNIISAEPTSKQ